MSKLIFINLPVRDLPRSIAFYEALGARKNEQFTTTPPPAWSFPRPSTSCC
jgi:predicted lactoylglutathione lyase